MFTPFYGLCVHLGSLPASGETFVNTKISLRQYGEFHNAMYHAAYGFNSITHLLLSSRAMSTDTDVTN